MKFKAPVAAISEAILRVADICAKNTSNQDDLSKYVLLELSESSLTVTGTDNNVQISANVSLAEGMCQEPGSILILATKAKDFFRSLGNDDEIGIELDETEDLIHVTNNTESKFNIRVKRLSEDTQFPRFQNPEQSSFKTFKIKKEVLKRMLEKSIFCVSNENFRDYLKGLRIEVKEKEIYVFALDGHRMAALDAELDEPASEEINILMTLRGVNELLKLIKNADESVEISATDDFISTKLGCYTLSNRLLKCKYPNVRNVIPEKCSPTIPVKNKKLATNVSRVAMFSNKRLNHVNLCFTTNNLSIYSQNSDHENGKADLPIDYSEKDAHLEVNLNADFLKDFFKAIDTEDVIFCFAPPYNNTLIKPQGDRDELGIRIRYVVSHIMV